MSNEPTGVRVLMLTVLMLMLLLCSLSSITFPAKNCMSRGIVTETCNSTAVLVVRPFLLYENGFYP